MDPKKYPQCVGLGNQINPPDKDFSLKKKGANVIITGGMYQGRRGVIVGHLACGRIAIKLPSNEVASVSEYYTKLYEPGKEKIKEY